MARKPRSHFKKKYIRQIVEHMKGGKSMRSFAALCNVPWSTMQGWMAQYPEFGRACELGEAHSYAWYEALGMAGAAGQLTMVKKEVIRYKKDANGKVVEEIHEKEMTSASFNASTWIFSMKNRFHWSDFQDQTGGGGGGDPPKETYKPPASLRPVKDSA